jgi:2Fe-2S ferredoxin
MPKVVFIEHNGTAHVVDAVVDKSAMQAAVAGRVPGIVAECGGGCTCATCHGYIDEAWLSKIPLKKEHEEVTLQGARDVRSNSRLTCQITIRPELDGLIIHLPVSQF